MRFKKTDASAAVSNKFVSSADKESNPQEQTDQPGDFALRKLEELSSTDRKDPATARHPQPVLIVGDNSEDFVVIKTVFD